MKFTLPRDTFPSITLSEDQRAALIEEADTVVKEIVAANDTFVTEGLTLENPNWKLIRAKEGVRVYRQRKRAVKQRVSLAYSLPVLQNLSQPHEHDFPRYQTVSSCTSVDNEAESHASLSSSSGISKDSIMEKMRPHGVALIALHGTVDGTMDDCLFGSVAATDEAWRLRSSHINDHLDDARLLVSLRAPTRADPCRFIGVKWFAKEHPVVLTGIVHQRDFLIVESTGFTRDSKNERVGYVLLHSITLRDIPELTHLGIVRGSMSFCYIYRQGGPGKVDVFCRGFFDSRGEMPGRLSVSLAADSAMCCTSIVDYAYIKKLRWLMTHASKPSPHRSTQTTPQRCKTCSKTFGKFALPFVESGLLCQICRETICMKCSVGKKITVHVSDTGSFQQCLLQFCLRCLQMAKEQSSWELALWSLESSAASCSSSTSTSASHTSATSQ